jgi:hypothetical protein
MKHVIDPGHKRGAARRLRLHEFGLSNLTDSSVTLVRVDCACPPPDSQNRQRALYELYSHIFLQLESLN